MKNSILVLALLSCSLHAADVVVVVSATSVTVNGAPAGKPADTIRNRPELAGAIQLALEQREAEQASALALAKSDAATALAALQSKLDAALATRAALIAKAKAKLAELPEDSRAIVLSVITEAETPEIEIRRAKLAAELAAKQKELDLLK
tara:strand:+ start:108 stop:557 length:450 start_codon:yes stop_codon:yes gene_type:complete